MLANDQTPRAQLETGSGTTKIGGEANGSPSISKALHRRSALPGLHTMQVSVKCMHTARHAKPTAPQVRTFGACGSRALGAHAERPMADALARLRAMLAANAGTLSTLHRMAQVCACAALRIINQY